VSEESICELADCRVTIASTWLNPEKRNPRLIALTSGLLAGIFLSIFYSTVGHRWPENYSSLQGALDSYISDHVAKYFAFRAIPIYLTGIFAAVTVERLGASVQTTLAVMLVVHLSMTTVRASIQLLRGLAQRTRRPTLLLLYLGTSLICAVSTIAASLTYPLARGFIPGPQELVTAAWTGVFVAVLAVFAQRVGAFEPSRGGRLLRARSDIGPDSWAYATEAAARNDCDPDLIRAIVAAESLQRPRWIRRLERAKGRFLGQGSYGIAQISSNTPLTDEESVDRLCQAFAGYYPERNQENGYILNSRMKARVEDHNVDPVFVELVCELHRELQPDAIAHSAALAFDQRFTIEVAAVERERHTWIIRGTASVYEGNLLLTSESADGSVQHGYTSATVGGPSRGEWKTEVPLNVRSLWLSEERMEESPPDADGQGTALVDLTNL
jgi:hypothetical protein